MSTASAIDPTHDTTNAQTPTTKSEDVAALDEGSEHEPKEATPPNPQDDASKVRPIHGWKWFLTCVCIYSTALLVGLDITIVADVQPNIVKSLGQIEKLTWVGVGFPLGSVATILPIGYAYGLFDIKSLYLSSIVLFEAGSALCGGAPTMDALIVGRVIAGVGGAGMYLGVLNYLGIFTTLRERNMMNALIGMVWGLGTILGPIIGGSFAVSSATWRWSFYINLVMAAVMAPVLIFYLPTHSPKPQERVLDKLRYMDWLGAGLIAAVFITFTVSLTFGGARWSWGSYRFILTITFSGVAVIATVLTQHFAILTTEARRIFPARFLRSRTLMLIFFATSACNTGLFIGTYYIPLVFQFARSDSAIKAAVRLLPFICVTITFILLNGALMPKFGYYMPWYLCSGVLMIIGGSLLHTINADTSPSRIYGYSVLLAIGCGSALQSGYSIAAVKVKPEEVVAAIGFINIAQLGSTVIALNIAGSVFQNLAFNNLKAALADHHYTAAELRSAIAGTQSVIFQQGDETVKQKAIQAIIKTMDSVFVLAIAAGAVSVISAVFMKRERLIMSAAAGG